MERCDDAEGGISRGKAEKSFGSNRRSQAQPISHAPCRLDNHSYKFKI